MAGPDRLERLTDLVLVLLDASRPLTLAEIARDVPGYPEGASARRQAFERDKRLLREESIPIMTETIEGPDQFGYRIDPEAFYLPDLHLTPDEQAALQLAVAGVNVGDPSGADGLAKLGATALGEARPLASLEAPSALPAVFEAVRTKAEVRFSYRGTSRAATLAGLWFRRGRWYSVGWMAEAGQTRVFRVDRIEGEPELGAPGSGALPHDFDPEAAVPDEPWLVGGEELETVEIVVDHVEAARVTAEVGAEHVSGPLPDGSVKVNLAVSNRRALRSWVLSLLDHAEVTAPADLRSEVVDWLSSMVSATEGSVAQRAQALELRESRADGARQVVAGGLRLRLRRLMALVGWLARVGGAPIDEVAARFGIPPSELVAELELAACCGTPPYSPDSLMEIVITDGRVEAFLPSELARPRRLTPSEGLAVLAAARTILSVPGADDNGALALAAAKLGEVLGAGHSVHVELERPPLLGDVQRLLDERRSALIEYHAVSSDEVTNRTVDPVAVISLEGHWYLDAYCHRSSGLRRFRVDRIRAIQDGEVIAARDAPQVWTTAAFVPGPGAQVVTLALGPQASWLAESVPVLSSEVGRDGALVVTLAVGGVAWLERLLLQAGPQATLTAPQHWRGLPAGAARRVLARYGS
ncbi:MAG: helix-turn-helix transcriptional regulator [Acidimicrobiales bacterium]